MSEYVKKNRKGRYYTFGKKYSGETYASIFEIAIQYCYGNTYVCR